jgi:GxxExxY protein
MDGLIDAARHVHECFGPGCSESVYQAALEVELRHRGVQYSSQQVIPLEHRGVAVGHVRADIIAQGVVLELKSVTHAPNENEKAQARRYAQLLGLEHALVINFGCAAFQFANAMT